MSGKATPDVTKGERRDPVRRTMAGVLIFQLGLALFLFLGDVGRDFSLPRFGPGAPRMDLPVGPGDQTRRYDPSDLPMTQPAGPDTAPAGPMPDRLVLEPLGQGAFLLQGRIAAGDANRIIDRLEVLAAAGTPVRTITLDSPGGSVTDALAIGRAIRTAGIDTTMRRRDICLSACPYILAGGVERRAASGARIGVHQHYFGENTLLPAFTAVSDIQRGQGEVMRFLDGMGVDPMLMTHALATPPDQIYLLLPEELTRYALLTTEEDG